MSDYSEKDYQRVVAEVGETRFLTGTGIEIVHEVSGNAAHRPVPEHVLFDFDGTLSLIRQGWPEVMVPMMVEVLQATGTDETPEALHELAYDFVMQLTGKQTIYQMMRLVEEVEKRGGKAEEPATYKQMYHDLLMERISSRRDDLRCGKVPPRDMLVPGSIELLEALQGRGVRLYLASGTDQAYVREEVALLQLDAYFGEHVYGALDDYKAFSKALVIERILETNAIRGRGRRLLGFGDGYVEIENVKTVGGIAVGVASDEASRSGKPDAWKRDRLIGVGADIVVPDFRDYAVLLAYLWNDCEGPGNAV